MTRDQWGVFLCYVFVAMVVTFIIVTVAREWAACYSTGGALVQVIDWPPVACVPRQEGR